MLSQAQQHGEQASIPTEQQQHGRAVQYASRSLKMGTVSERFKRILGGRQGAGAKQSF